MHVGSATVTLACTSTSLRPRDHNAPRDPGIHVRYNAPRGGQRKGILSGTLRRHLEEQITGEVRFDAVSRALYSTDASVYQIHPLGVVIVRSRDDIVRTVNLARAHGVSITARGGGTSQAGQAIGEGLQLDTSKYFNRLLELNVQERWAIVEPGIVLDALNASLKAHGLRFAPDISTASRATIGGMISNNSSGARSVLYGKTIDHVLELDVVLSDGSQVHLHSLNHAERDAACLGDTRIATCYRTVRQVARECAGEIERRYPKVLRRVGGYNLDEFVDETKPFNLSKIVVGSEGTLGMITAAKINLVPLPKAKAVLVIEFDELLDALGATPVILEHQPSAIEVMDRFILNHARESPAMDRMRRAILQTDNPGALLCVELYADSAARSAAASRGDRAAPRAAPVRPSPCSQRSLTRRTSGPSARRRSVCRWP